MANVNDHLSTAHFVDLCEITVDMTKLKSSIRPRTNQRGAKYYVVNFDVVILFGLTELKAQMAWTQDVSRRFSPEYCNVSDAI